MKMADKTINCVASGQEFTWSEGEQRFYKERGLSRPKRCSSCRTRPRSAGRSDGPDRSAATRPSRRAGRSLLSNPVNRIGMLILGGSALAAIALAMATKALDVVASWLLAINVVTFATYAYDKLVSSTRRARVPERVLLMLALAGGTVAAIIGMFGLRHKTSKRGFQARFLGVLIVQAILVACYYLLVKPRLSG
jgi:uncharacterized membrane protein YsdA (DUF1294 family)